MFSLTTFRSGDISLSIFVVDLSVWRPLTRYYRHNKPCSGVPCRESSYVVFNPICCSKLPWVNIFCFDDNLDVVFPVVETGASYQCQNVSWSSSSTSSPSSSSSSSSSHHHHRHHYHYHHHHYHHRHHHKNMARHAGHTIFHDLTLHNGNWLSFPIWCW